MRILLIITGLWLVFACQQANTQPPAAAPRQPVSVAARDTSALEKQLILQGLKNITSVDNTVQVEMMYSTKDNFLHADVYESYDQCYLQPAVAEMLAKASAALQRDHPELRLHVYDCVRPRSVQYKMWDIVKNTPQQDYVADPSPKNKGSMHNYGCAVDLTVCRTDGTPLDMGTPFDFFGQLAQPRFEQMYLKSSKLTREQFENRLILRRAMHEGGFVGILTEWWHFDAFKKDSVAKWYKIVE